MFVSFEPFQKNVRAEQLASKAIESLLHVQAEALTQTAVAKKSVGGR